MRFLATNLVLADKSSTHTFMRCAELQFACEGKKVLDARPTTGPLWGPSRRPLEFCSTQEAKRENCIRDPPSFRQLFT